MIKLIGEKLKQYDLDRIVQLAPRHGYKLETVRFWKADAEDPLTVAFREQDDMTVADIPNILLKKFGVLTVEAVSVDDCGIFYVEKSTINVSKRPMPEGYEYHETEVLELGKGGGMGGADWNAAEGEPGHVLNRTHWEEVSVEEVNITFDGDMTGKESVLLDDGVYLVKVSDAVPTMEALKASTIKAMSMTESGMQEQVINVAEAEAAGTASVTQFNENVVFVMSGEMPIIAVASEAGEINGLAFSRGTNFICVPDFMYVSSLPGVAETTTVHKLDNKFIDAEWMATKTVEVQELCGETVVTFDDYGTDASGNPKSLCTDFPCDLSALAIGTKITVYLNGVGYETEIRVDDPDAATLCIYAGNFALGGADTNTDEPFLILISGTALDGAALYSGSAGDYTVKIDVVAVTYNKMPSEFIDMPEIYNGRVTGMVNGTVQTPNLYVLGGDTDYDRYYRLSFKHNRLVLININDNTDQYEISVTKLTT